MAVQLPIEDRESAGLALAQALLPCLTASTNMIVLALPRGGVPVAARVARALGAELDLIIVRKLGLPRNRELGFGAIASGGIRVLNEDVIRYRNVGQSTIEAVTEEENRELRRRETAYRGEHPLPVLQGRTVILVDDGIATGATMSAAIDAIRQQRPKEIIIAVPVAPEETLDELKTNVEQVVCLATPTPFFSIGQWYRDFSQTSDSEVRELLREAWNTP